MRASLWSFCAVFVLFGAALGAIIEDGSKKLYEPNPPVRRRVLFGINYTNPETNEPTSIDVGIELYDTVVPKTVDNFFALATGVKGQLGDKVIDISYKDTLFTRVIPGFVIQGGDVLPGIAPFSIYGMSFEDENFELKHDRPGRVSMANHGPGTNACQFFITVSEEPQTHLDGKHVVFGQVFSGLEDLLKYVQHVKTDDGDKPVDPVSITYSFSDQLMIAKMDEMHAQYKENVQKFRDGDLSYGITLEEEMKEGAKDEVKLENDYYYYKHPYAKFVFACLFLGAIGMVYANRRFLLPKARNIVSVRS